MTNQNKSLPFRISFLCLPNLEGIYRRLLINVVSGQGKWVFGKVKNNLELYYCFKKLFYEDYILSNGKDKKKKKIQQSVVVSQSQQRLFLFCKGNIEQKMSYFNKCQSNTRHVLGAGVSVGPEGYGRIVQSRGYIAY